MQDAVSFPADVWSICATLFHLASGRLPFECPNPMAAFIAIAQDLDAPPPDVRDAAPEGLRSIISSSFATALKKGLQRRLEARLNCSDELASALHDCLVERGEELYTVFISYRVSSERCHAALLYDLLNNTITPAGHRVIVFLDSRRLVKGAAWEDGFVQGLLHSLVAIPLVSRGFLAPLSTLAGLESDRRDSVALELMLMQALAELFEAAPLQNPSAGVPAVGLEAIYPIFIGDPCAPAKGLAIPSCPSRTLQPEATLSWGDSSSCESRGAGMFGYPRSGNFFNDCAQLIAALPDVVSPPAAAAAMSSLSACGVHSVNAPGVRTVRETVQGVLKRQGAELWASGASEPEEISADSDILLRATSEPTEPPLDALQLGMIKAQFRTLIPAIHAVVDRAQSRAAGRVRPRKLLCASEVMAGGVVERHESSQALRSGTWSEAEQLPSIYSAFCRSASASDSMGRYVGPNKVETTEVPAPREDCSQPAEWRAPAAGTYAVPVSCLALQQFRALG
jgi:hypothetical protein